MRNPKPHSLAHHAPKKIARAKRPPRQIFHVFNPKTGSMSGPFLKRSLAAASHAFGLGCEIIPYGQLERVSNR